MNEIRIGDCVELMRAMVAEGIRVQTCITSPPYYGLRDYGTASWDGGDPACDHVEKTARNDITPEALARRSAEFGTGQGSGSDVPKMQFAGACGKCGAVRVDSQMGLEKSPAEYLEKMVDVFRLVRELLADDGTLWLNMGDSYARNGGEPGGGNRELLHLEGTQKRMQSIPDGSGFKPKDLMGMPWRLALALQADGWYLRSDIIWHKPNPMPESVTDRPTKSHEYIFLLSKSDQYFYDADAIKEKSTGTAHARGDGVNPKASPVRGWAEGPGSHTAIAHARPKEANDGKKFKVKYNESFSASVTEVVDNRNKRSVWTVASEAYSEAHFATFPRALIVPCVLAGSRAGDIVFDPFMGSGTTALVAKENGRRYLGCELNPAYKALQDDRLRQEVLFRG